MRRVLLAATLALLLGGCASYAWVKPDVTAEVRARDEDSCRAEARDLANEYAYGGFGAPPLYSPGPRPWMGPATDPSWQGRARPPGSPPPLPAPRRHPRRAAPHRRTPPHLRGGTAAAPSHAHRARS